MRINYWILVTLFILSGCSSKSKNLTTDVGTMSEGDRLAGDEFFEEARTQYTRIKTEFPESPLQLEADLKIADSYFLEENFIAAASAYEEFVRTYPARPETPRALFQLGMSHVNQMPSTSQRDTRSTAKVIDVFTRLLVDYPISEYSKEAQNYIDRARNQLAEKIFEIGKFYERTEKYSSAARRFEDLVQNYPDAAMAEEAFARQIKSLRGAGENDRADTLASEFQEKFPKSEFTSMIKP